MNEPLPLPIREDFALTVLGIEKLKSLVAFKDPLYLYFNTDRINRASKTVINPEDLANIPSDH